MKTVEKDGKLFVIWEPHEYVSRRDFERDIALDPEDLKGIMSALFDAIARAKQTNEEAWDRVHEAISIHLGRDLGNGDLIYSRPLGGFELPTGK